MLSTLIIEPMKLHAAWFDVSCAAAALLVGMLLVMGAMISSSVGPSIVKPL